ncbi:MAG TPA: Asp-tRNA(Asn)/Glu-tRNA(Gln) amidotransferase subunit GatA [Phycisphaerales bacterium]|nr:Asp-tRNA(Asn)/Glu-tRNA(Gln) amidotransferase subunit GatA [Phycisphaerales bacterium]
MRTAPAVHHAFSSILETAAAIRNREVRAKDVIQNSLDAIAAQNPSLNAFREVLADGALEQAEKLDADAGDRMPALAGIPIAIKDNIATTAGRTTCGSRLLEEYSSPYNSTVVERLLAAGAIIIGKTNCDEFAMGSSTENSAFGVTRNPWDQTRVPGGSSGGSAAAVAAGLCCAALGSDTGGSIRQPAAMCGITGLKPSYGRVSRYGLVAFGSSLDQIGPFSRTVGDAALLLSIIAGADPFDASSAPNSVPNYLNGLDDPITNLRIGVPRQYLDERNDPEVNDALRSAIETYTSLGATIVEIDLPLTEYGIAVYYVIAPAEASSNLARFDGIRYGRRAKSVRDQTLDDLYAASRSEGFGGEVQRRIMLGTYVLSSGYYDAYYNRALKVRRLIKHEFDSAFATCDALLGPTAPTPAFKLGEKLDPLAMYLNDVYTVNANIAGTCAISIPAGFSSTDKTHLPIGLQLQCPAFEEHRLLRIARMFEKATEFWSQHPPHRGAVN